MDRITECVLLRWCLMACVALAVAAQGPAVAQTLEPREAYFCADPAEAVIPTPQCGSGDSDAGNLGRFVVYFGDHGNGCEAVGIAFTSCWHPPVQARAEKRRPVKRLPKSGLDDFDYHGRIYRYFDD